MPENFLDRFSEFLRNVEPAQLATLCVAIIAFSCLKDVAKKWLSALLSIAGCLAILYTVAPDLYATVWEWMRTAARQIFSL